MNFIRTSAQVALAISILLAPLWAQTVLDAKTVKAIAEKEKELVELKKQAEEANRRLQDDYAHLQNLFELARSGRDVDAIRDLERVLEQPTKDAVEAGFTSSRGKRAFKRNLSSEVSKTEHSLLKAFKPQLLGALDEAYESLSEDGQKSPSPSDIARVALEKLFPSETPFWQHWNETLYKTIDSREAFMTARKALKTAEDSLMVLQDPKTRFSVGAPEGMALVEGGSLTIESTYGFEAPRRKGRTRDFYIDLREVTHAEYWSKFWINLDDKILKQTYLPMTKEDGREFPSWVRDEVTGEYAPLPDTMNLPVTGIDAVAAQAFARSQGKRLPTEAEWLAAATATPGKCSEFPWGEDYRDGASNDSKLGLKTTQEVGLFKDGRSFHGIYDMAGNVKEWTFTTIEGRDVDEEIPDGAVLAIRGGSYQSSPSNISLKWRWQLPARNTRENDVGFRCAKDAK